MIPKRCNSNTHPKEWRQFERFVKRNGANTDELKRSFENLSFNCDVLGFGVENPPKLQAEERWRQPHGSLCEVHCR